MYNIRLYEVAIKLTVICFENNIKCSLNVNKRISVNGIELYGIETHDIHGYFCVLTVGQRTPDFGASQLQLYYIWIDTIHFHYVGHRQESVQVFIRVLT